MEDKRIKLLGHEPIPKAINKMTLPAIIGMLVMAVYNVADTMFVAWLGTEATSATQVVFPLMLLPSAIGLAFGIGGGNYVSRLLGRKDYKAGEQVAITSLVTGIVVGFIMTVFNLVFLEDILGFFGASTEIMEMSKSYGFYIVLGGGFIVANMVMNNMLRSEGSAKLSMIGMSSGAIFNIFLDPIFIFVLGWGVKGAAIATTISQILSFVILLSNFLRHKTIIRLRLKRLTVKWSLYREIMVVGAPTFFRQILLSLSMAIMNKTAMAYGGADLLAAIAIVTKVILIPQYVIFGLGQGFQPVAGFNIGAGNRDRVMKALKYTMGVSLGIVTVSGMLMVVFSQQIMDVFKAADGVAVYAISGVRYYAISLILLSGTNTIGVFYQALGKGKESLLLSIARQGLFFIPAIFILPGMIGAEGVLMSQMVADLFTVALAIGIIIPFISSNQIDKELANHLVMKEESA